MKNIIYFYILVIFCILSIPANQAMAQEDWNDVRTLDWLKSFYYVHNFHQKNKTNKSLSYVCMDNLPMFSNFCVYLINKRVSTKCLISTI